VRYSNSEIEALAHTVLTDGLCILRGHFPAEKLTGWRERFLPLLHEHIAREGDVQNRGRNATTSPFHS
jgi:hypothetical protein